MLNPFRGAINTIRYDSAEAVTIDGCYWDIYVRNSDLVKELESNNNIRIQTSEIRYGRWSKKGGLRRGPQIDSSDFRKMEKNGKAVFQYLTQHANDIPFPFKDNYELWLLDDSNTPLALLNSVVYQEEIDLQARTLWSSGIAYQESFKLSTKMQLNPAEYLNQLVHKLATQDNNNSNFSAQWIYRNPDGSGLGLNGINITPEIINRTIATTIFPQFFINSDLFNKDDQKFIRDYLEWLSPWLLVLESLSTEQRIQLEIQAKQQVLIIAKQYLLYPNIIDKKLINSSRVAAMMTSNKNFKNQNEVMSIDYIELNDPTKIG